MKTQVPAADRKLCVARVSVEARDAWASFCDRHLVDRAVFAEVIAMWMDEGGDLPPLVAQWVTDARDLKNQRRRRG